MKKIFLISVLSAFLCISTSNAQQTPQSAEFGPFIGTSYYMGELNSTTLFYMPSFAIGGIYRHNLDDRWAMRFEGTYARLRGNDAKSNNTYQQARNENFNTTLGDVGLLVEFNFMPYDKALIKRNYYTPYVLIGGSLVIIPEPKYPFEFAIPFGVGFKYAITKKMSFGVEWTYRFTFSDYLDRVDADNFQTSTSTTIKQQSYNPMLDLYSFAGIVLTYEIFRGAKPCPGY